MLFIVPIFIVGMLTAFQCQDIPIIGGVSSLTLQLLEFKGEGLPCQTSNSTKCNLGFSYCIEPYQSGAPLPMLCHAGFTYDGFSGQITTNSSDIEFRAPHFYEKWRNPNDRKVEDWQGTYVKIRIVNYVNGSPQTPAEATLVKFVSPYYMNLTNNDVIFNATGLTHTNSTLTFSAGISCHFGPDSSGTACKGSDIPGGVAVAIDLHTYVNPGGQITPLLKCSLGYSPCNFNFQICVESNSEVTQNVGICNGNGGRGFYNTDVIDPTSNQVTFNHQEYGTYTNPYRSYVLNWTQSSLKVDVYDETVLPISAGVFFIELKSVDFDLNVAQSFSTDATKGYGTLTYSVTPSCMESSDPDDSRACTIPPSTTPGSTTTTTVLTTQTTTPPVTMNPYIGETFIVLQVKTQLSDDDVHTVELNFASFICSIDVQQCTAIFLTSTGMSTGKVKLEVKIVATQYHCDAARKFLQATYQIWGDGQIISGSNLDTIVQQLQAQPISAFNASLQKGIDDNQIGISKIENYVDSLDCPPPPPPNSWWQRHWYVIFFIIVVVGVFTACFARFAYKTKLHRQLKKGIKHMGDYRNNLNDSMLAPLNTTRATAPASEPESSIYTIEEDSVSVVAENGMLVLRPLDDNPGPSRPQQLTISNESNTSTVEVNDASSISISSSTDDEKVDELEVETMKPGPQKPEVPVKPIFSRRMFKRSSESQTTSETDPVNSGSELEEMSLVKEIKEPAVENEAKTPTRSESESSVEEPIEEPHVTVSDNPAGPITPPNTPDGPRSPVEVVDPSHEDHRDLCDKVSTGLSRSGSFDDQEANGPDDDEHRPEDTNSETTPTPPTSRISSMSFDNEVDNTSSVGHGDREVTDDETIQSDDMETPTSGSDLELQLPIDTSTPMQPNIEATTADGTPPPLPYSAPPSDPGDAVDDDATFAVTDDSDEVDDV